ncbi:MAG: hypothetical protein IH991_24090 [Planctomycetes bacterium]|nr:hypothetical protein [Planctomycetota bacterium]
MIARTLCALAAFCLLTGCNLRGPAPALPNNYSLVREQLVIYSDFRLPERHRLVDELVALRGDLAVKLKLPMSDEPIYVYVFEGPGPFQDYMQRKLPHIPQRRALFVESDTSLTVFTHWGEQIAEDLRHEVTHGYLHSVVRNVPLWLDEGIAEYFEVPRGRSGLNQPHVDLLQSLHERDEWKPDLRRLERFQHISEMTQLDYAESWLWVHLLLETTPQRRDFVSKYLAQLRATGTAARLSVKWPSRESTSLGKQRELEAAATEHLKSLAVRK